MTASTKLSTLPDHVSSLPVAEKLKYLDSEASVAEMTKSARKRLRKALNPKSEKKAVEVKEADNAKVAKKALRQVCSATHWEDFCRGVAYPPVADHGECRMRKADKVLRKSTIGVGGELGDGFGVGEADVLWPAAYLQNGSTYDVVVEDIIARRRSMGLSPDVFGPIYSADWYQVHEKPKVKPSKIHLIDSAIAREDTSGLKDEIAYYKASGYFSDAAKYDYQPPI